MSDFLNLLQSLIDALTLFLSTPPVSYLFGLVLFCIILSVVAMLLRNISRWG